MAEVVAGAEHRIRHMQVAHSLAVRNRVEHLRVDYNRFVHLPADHTFLVTDFALRYFQNFFTCYLSSLQIVELLPPAT